MQHIPFAFPSALCNFLVLLTLATNILSTIGMHILQLLLRFLFQLLTFFLLNIHIFLLSSISFATAFLHCSHFQVRIQQLLLAKLGSR